MSMVEKGWWQFDDGAPVTPPAFQVDDVRFVQPVGFVWFGKPRYRIKARSAALQPKDSPE